EEIPIASGPWEAAAFTSDSRRLILASQDGTILVLNAQTFELERSFAFGEWIVRLRVAAGDQVLALGATGITALDLRTGLALWSCPTAGSALDLTPDGSYVITLDRGEWVAFEALTGREIRWPGRDSKDPAWSISVASDDTAVSFLDDRLVITTIPPLGS
ncbi:MAG TPA: hypothetical protein VL503_02285, partial [Candidatus Omnitrophota bacterium]|nr:hypothetical protein [Candidatus Omnitrophota bacterium]